MISTSRPVNSLSRTLLKAVLVLLVFVALVDPADTIFHFKAPAFVFVILICAFRIGLTSKTLTFTAWALVVTLALVIPLLWTVIGLLHQNLHSGDATFGTLKTFLFLFMLPVLLAEDIDLMGLLVRVVVLIALITLIMVAINTFSPIIFLGIYEFTIAKQNAIITPSRDLFGFGGGQFYYKTSPLMIFAFAYFCRRLFLPYVSIWLPLLMCVLYTVALMFSGTRANVLAVLFLFGAFALAYIRRRAGLAAALACGAVSIGLVAATIIPKFADTKEESNLVKLGHARSYQAELNERPSALLWGEGVNTGFYSQGYQDWTTVTELSYLELIRVFGLPTALLLAAGLLWLACALFKAGDFAMACAYMAYLAICGSNPLLISSTGFLVICAVCKQSIAPSEGGSMFYLPMEYTPESASAPTPERGLVIT